MHLTKKSLMFMRQLIKNEFTLKIKERSFCIVYYDYQMHYDNIWKYRNICKNVEKQLFY